MEEFYSLYQEFLLIGCLSFLGMILIGAFLYKMREILYDALKRTMSVGLLGLTIGAIVYGGSKAITPQNTATDENITLYDIGVSISNEVVDVAGSVETNFVNAIITIKVSEDSVIPYPFWFRESNYNEWTNITALASFTTEKPVLDTIASGLGTNVYTWTSLDWTNNYMHAQWYIGSDLPPVEVDVEGESIEVNEFCITSKKVWIKFHVQDGIEIPEGTTIEVQRKNTRGRWEVVDEIPAVRNGTYTWHGFIVDRSTSWRLHMTMTKD